jgi:rhamnosyltransferase
MFKNRGGSDVYAIIVTFYPNLKQLNQLVSTVASQVHKVVIVDNTPKLSEFKIAGVNNLLCIHNKKNLGIAKALNQGVQVAQNEGALFAILFDQDSSPGTGLVSSLLNTYNELKNAGYTVSGVGPRFINTITQAKEYFYSIESNKHVTDKKSKVANTYYSDFMITSGALIPVSALNFIGEFESSLFIDYVDTEWNFRALSKGYRCFGTDLDIMEHSLGDKCFNCFGIKKFFLHSPIRVYYQVRNAGILKKRKYMPQQLLKKNRIFISILYAFVSILDLKADYLKAIIKGWRGE